MNKAERVIDAHESRGKKNQDKEQSKEKEVVKAFKTRKLELSHQDEIEMFVLTCAGLIRA